MTRAEAYRQGVSDGRALVATVPLVNHERVLWQELRLSTRPTHRAWALGALRAVRATDDQERIRP